MVVIIKKKIKSFSSVIIILFLNNHQIGRFPYTTLCTINTTMQFPDSTPRGQTEHAFTRQLSKRCLFGQNHHVLKQESFHNILSMKKNNSIMSMAAKSPMTRLASRFNAESYGFGQAADAVRPAPHFEAPQTPGSTRRYNKA